MNEVQFTEAEWLRLRAAADGADKLSSEASNTRPWNPDFNFVGLVGEAVFARVSGMAFYPERRIKRLADGGQDFAGGIDVKAVVRSPPLLMRLRTDPLKAAFFALVQVNLVARSGQYIGYATREDLDAAPDREFGYGPTRTLGEAALIKKLPPSADPQEGRKQRWARAWRELYGRRLQREAHEAQRDRMFAWAREHSELRECLAGHSRSVSFYDPTDYGSVEF